MTLRVSTKVLLHVWSFNIYCTLFTEQQPRHMIKSVLKGLNMEGKDRNHKNKMPVSFYFHVFRVTRETMIRNQPDMSVNKKDNHK